jgi:hypothetical protein
MSQLSGLHPIADDRATHRCIIHQCGGHQIVYPGLDKDYVRIEDDRVILKA